MPEDPRPELAGLLERTGAEITRLMESPDADRHPDERAHVLAQRMLVQLSDRDVHIAASDVSVDPDRAIRLLWSKAGKNVELVFDSSPAEMPYLYHSDQVDFGVDEDPDTETVIRWLDWLLTKLSRAGFTLHDRSRCAGACLRDDRRPGRGSGSALQLPTQAREENCVYPAQKREGQ